MTNQYNTMTYDLSCGIRNKEIFGKTSRDVSTEAMRRMLTDESFRAAAEPTIKAAIEKHLRDADVKPLPLHLTKIAPVFSHMGLNISASIAVEKGGQDAKKSLPYISRALGNSEVQNEVGTALTKLVKDRLLNLG